MEIFAVYRSEPKKTETLAGTLQASYKFCIVIFGIFIKLDPLLCSLFLLINFESKPFLRFSLFFVDLSLFFA